MTQLNLSPGDRGQCATVAGFDRHHAARLPGITAIAQGCQAVVQIGRCSGQLPGGRIRPCQRYANLLRKGQDAVRRCQSYRQLAAVIITHLYARYQCGLAADDIQPVKRQGLLRCRTHRYPQYLYRIGRVFKVVVRFNPDTGFLHPVAAGQAQALQRLVEVVDQPLKLQHTACQRLHPGGSGCGYRQTAVYRCQGQGHRNAAQVVFTVTDGSVSQPDGRSGQNLREVRQTDFRRIQQIHRNFAGGIQRRGITVTGMNRQFARQLSFITLEYQTAQCLVDLGRSTGQYQIIARPGHSNRPRHINLAPLRC